jgi:hypothetical protein
LRAATQQVPNDVLVEIEQFLANADSDATRWFR